MNDEEPLSASDLISALRQHPELMAEVRRRLIWTCSICGGEGVRELADGSCGTCSTCEGSGSLPPTLLVNRSTTMTAYPSMSTLQHLHRQSVAVEVTLQTTSGEGALEVANFLQSLWGRGHPWM